MIAAPSPILLEQRPTPLHNAGDRQPSVTVVCCVESGPLETTTLMMIESLRHWGGRFTNVPVIAVTPRFGPPLRRRTLERFDQMNVRYIRRRPPRDLRAGEFAWYNFLNKPLSLVLAEEHITTDIVVWLDADILITGAPEAFDLEDGVDFSACPSDRNLGSAGEADPHEPYWTRMCAVHGITPQQLPWVTTCREGDRIRLYFNGGVLAYRRASGYARAYLAGCRQALHAKFRSKAAGLFFAEQATAGLIAVQQKLQLAIMPEQCNYAVGSKVEGHDAEAFSQARVLHYHDSLWSHFFPRFLEMCRAGQPALYEWIRQSGPLVNDAPWAWRAMSKALKRTRTAKATRFEAACHEC